ncbi:MAG: cupin domain-containing protein [Polyangiaceae bacterium]
MIRSHAEIEAVTLPGIVHRTLAGSQEGLKGMEVWMQTIAPGAETPMHSHDCEEVVVVLQGSGFCELEGEMHTFAAGSTLIVPRGAVHRIVNNGPTEMLAVASLSTAPVIVQAPDGSRIPLPWDAPSS